jgi:hypothetical protein
MALDFAGRVGNRHWSNGSFAQPVEKTEKLGANRRTKSFSYACGELRSKQG